MIEQALRLRAELLAAAACIGLAGANAARVPFLVGAGAAAALAAAAAAAAAHGRARIAYACAALLVAGWAWGSARLDDLDRSRLGGFAERTASATVVVTGPTRRSSFQLRVPAEVVSYEGRDVREAVLLELPLGRAPPQGAYLRVTGRLERPRSEDDGFDERTWLRRRGVHFVLHATRWNAAGRRGGIGGVADRIRERLAETIAPGLGGERRAVIAGVVLGEDEGLAEELRDAFRVSGLYHLLAVSGQNVALVAAGVIGVAWLAGISRLAAHVAVLAAIAAYVLAVGWQPSVVRAGIAGGLASLAWLTARQRNRWHFMLVGASVLLAWNPYSLLEPGFQLSFVAVAAIFLAVPPLERALEGYPVPNALAAAVAVSVACGLATAPILWFHFDAVPVYSVLSNALAFPAVGPLLGLAFASAATAPVLPEASLALAWVNAWVAAYVAACARFVAGFPYAQIASADALAVLAALGALVLVILRLERPRMARALVVSGLGAIVFLTWSAQLGAGGALPPPSGLRLSFLDVGQGDGILVEAPGAAVLVDQGPPEGHVAAQLRALGLRRLTAIVLTHPQRDHVGGAAEVFERLRVGFALDPRLRAESEDETAALAAAREHGVRVLTARAGAVYTVGRLRFRVLWPQDPGDPGDDPNEHAVVLRVTYGSVDALLTADAESNVTLPLHPPPVEILKIAHHGSADARLGELVRQLRPRVAVISVGARNDYGHPAPSTLATLRRWPGLRLYRTDEDGRVTVESDGERLWVKSER